MDIIRDKHNVLIKPGMLIKHVQHAQVKEVEIRDGVLYAGEMKVSTYHSSVLEVVQLTNKPIRGLLLYCPLTGDKYPYPSTPEALLEVYGGMPWKYNPYSGTERNELDIKSDPFGHGIVQDGLPLLA